MVKLKFEECFIDVTKGNIRVKQSEYLDSGNIPIIDQGKKLIGGYSNDKNTIVNCDLPCIIYGDHSRNIKFIDTPFALGSDGVRLLKSTSNIVAKYGYYFLQTVKLPNIGYDRSFKYLKRVQIPIPDIESQNRIVAILDKIKTVLNKREDSISKYDELLRAIFLETFGNPMGKPNQWNLDTIEKSLIHLSSGTSYSGEENKLLEDDELGVLKVSAVTKGFFNANEFKAVKKNVIKRQIIHPKKGDLLFSRANTLELVGATCIIDADHDNLFLPDKLWKVETDETILKKTYLHYVLQNKDVRKTFLSIATGSSGSMLNISMDKFRKIIIPYPPIELQEQFEKTYLKYTGLKAILKKSHKHISDLFGSISQLAFKGELDFNTAVDLEMLLENDYTFFKENSNQETIRLLLKRLDKNELNDNKFYDQRLYDKAKEFVFELLKEHKIKQVFDGSKRVKLTI